MRRFVVLVFSLLAALVLSAGVAQADTTAPTPTPTPGHHHPGFPGRPGVPGYGYYNQLGGPLYAGGAYGGYLPRGFPSLLEGSLLNLQALGLVNAQVGEGVPVCQFQHYADLDRFGLQHFGGAWNNVRTRWFNQGDAELAALQQQACVSSLTGNTIITQDPGYALQGTNLLGVRLGLGDANFNLCLPQFSTWQGLDSYGERTFGNRWSGARIHFGGNPLRTFSALRAPLNCPAIIPGSYVDPDPQIVPVPVPVQAPSTTVASPPAVAPSTAPGNGTASAPVVPYVRTGDGSTND